MRQYFRHCGSPSVQEHQGRLPPVPTCNNFLLIRLLGQEGGSNSSRSLPCFLWCGIFGIPAQRQHHQKTGISVTCPPPLCLHNPNGGDEGDAAHAKHQVNFTPCCPTQASLSCLPGTWQPHSVSVGPWISGNVTKAITPRTAGRGIATTFRGCFF